MPERALLSVQATPDTSGIRIAEFQGVEHTVIPTVALVEGVLWPANAAAPELALAEEFGRFPDGWNGRPVVFDHPKVNGVPVSANSDPKVLEEVAFGYLFNTRVENNKLLTEIWIDDTRVAEMSEDIQDAVKRLKEGDEVVEVSTGLFTMSEVTSGQYEGQEFEAIWRNIVPDHLAVLPEGIIGACSVEDGCGAPRTNKEFKPVMNAAQIKTNCKCGGSCDKCEAAASPSPSHNGGAHEERKGVFEKVFDIAGSFFNFKGNSKELSDRDTRTAITSALAKTEEFFFILAVFDHGDGTGVFVYETWDALFERTFSVDGANVTVSDERTEVRPVTQFVPVTTNTGAEGGNDQVSTQESNMDPKDKLVDDLIANEATQFTADDRSWLASMEEEQLNKLSPIANSNQDSGDKVSTDVTEDGDDGDGGDAPEVTDNASQVTTDEYIAQAPPEVREVLKSSLKLHQSRKSRLIKSILANSRCKFSEQQLNAKSLDEVEQIASLATDITYEGSAPSGDGMRDNSDADAPPPAPLVFPKKQA